MLGKTVKVIVDRPLGSYHPEYKNLYYPVNYGYVEGVAAPDEEYQDAYILGVDIPLKEFTGKIIAVINRLDDNEDKLVVAPENMIFSKEEITDQTQFQERFFKTEIKM
ncbi:MAG: inorganic pyrophosphatase [Oscillospiraceae bacterium]